MKKLMLGVMIASITSLTCAVDTAKINMSVIRNQNINHSGTFTLQIGKPAQIVFMDGSTYVEAEVIEINSDSIIFGLLISSRAETGAFIVRGMPKMTVYLNDGLGMSSLNCNGREEQFTLLVAACIA